MSFGVSDRLADVLAPCCSELKCRKFRRVVAVDLGAVVLSLVMHLGARCAIFPRMV